MSTAGRPARRAIVVYSRVGGGHQSAARALAAALERESSGRVSARATDVYLEQSRFPVTRFPAIYARLARYHPRLWAALFHSTNGGRLDPTPLLRPFMASGIARLLAAERPDLVVSVMPGINGLLAEGRQQRSPRPRLEIVLTDWSDIHATWLASTVDHYTVPTDAAAADLVGCGAAPERVEVVGIPVRAEFAGVRRPKEVSRRIWASLDLDPNRFTILTMVGAEGSPRALRNIEALAAQPLDAQLVILCGHNERLKRHVEQVPGVAPRRVLGFVGNVADLMRAADLLITKAGGMTLAEAFCCGVPTVVNDVLPGQEAGNTRFALRHGAVEYAERPEELVERVRELRASDARRAALAARARALACPTATTRIAARMLARLEGA